MSDSVLYLLGNFLGRAMISWILVWLVFWLLSRGRVRVALRRSVHWYSILLVLILGLLGMATGALRQGGVHASWIEGGMNVKETHHEG